MTRAELIVEMVNRKNDLNPKVIEYAVKRIIEFMISSFVKGHRIEIRGFGSFGLRMRMPRQARNPKTGEVVVTELKHVLYFKPGKSLRERINNAAQLQRAKQTQE
jgi:integration host factor subunit beta